MPRKYNRLASRRRNKGLTIEDTYLEVVPVQELESPTESGAIDLRDSPYWRELYALIDKARRAAGKRNPFWWPEVGQEIKFKRYNRAIKATVISEPSNARILVDDGRKVYSLSWDEVWKAKWKRWDSN
jgi:hypothetical protein